VARDAEGRVVNVLAIITYRGVRIELLGDADERPSVPRARAATPFQAATPSPPRSESPPPTPRRDQVFLLR
jgi:hypothetical protein